MPFCQNDVKMGSNWDKDVKNGVKWGHFCKISILLIDMLVLIWDMPFCQNDVKMGWCTLKSDNRSVFPTKFHSINMCNMSYFCHFDFFCIGAYVHRCIMIPILFSFYTHNF